MASEVGGRKSDVLPGARHMIEFESQAKWFRFKLRSFFREIVLKHNLLVKTAQDELSGIKLGARKTH